MSRWSASDFDKWKKRNGNRQIPLPFTGQEPAKKARKKKSAEEFVLQVKCNDHFIQYYQHLLPLFFHVVNQAVVNSKEINGRLKALGRRRGVWDMKLQVPKGEYWGIWFEFKSGKGELSDDQKIFRDKSIEVGCKYKFVEIKKLPDFAKEVAEYLEDNRFKF